MNKDSCSVLITPKIVVTLKEKYTLYDKYSKS